MPKGTDCLMTKSTPRYLSGPHLARCRKRTRLEPGLEKQSLPIHEGPDRCQEQMPGCLEVDSRAACFSQTRAAVSSSDPLVGQQWEVSIFPQTVGDKFPIRLISKEHSWHEGVCRGLRFSLWQTLPELSLGKLPSTGRGPPGVCAQRAGLSPAHSHCLAHRQLGLISQSSRNKETHRTKPLSHEPAGEFWLPVGKTELTLDSFSVAKACARSGTRTRKQQPGSRMHPGMNRHGRRKS